MTYIPRAGSKTEAAVNYLRSHGGSALRTELRDECDIDINNQSATFQAAINNGLLEHVELPGGMGYRLTDGAAPEIKANDELGKKPRRQRGASIAAPELSETDFRVGVFSDDSLRLEGDEASLRLETFEGPRIAVTITPAAVRKMAEFLSRMDV